MSATKTTIDFPAKARELVNILETANRALEDAARVCSEIRSAAAADDNGGLPRLGFAVESEAESLEGLFRDNADELGFNLDSWIRDANDLAALIELALAESEEAVAS